jgi:antitoxin VapB
VRRHFCAARIAGNPYVRTQSGLPVANRVETKEVFISKDPITGDVIRSPKPNSWHDFFAALRDVDVPTDFLSKEERDQGPEGPDPFQDWTE